MATPQPDSYLAAVGSTIYAGLPVPIEPGVGTVVMTVDLVNETAGAQPANFVTKMFGVPLPQGAIPSGQYPQFSLEDGTVCPATVMGISTWPDGSIKMCSAMARIPVSIPAASSRILQIKNGGVAPADSSRTTSDLTPADILAEIVGVTNLTGTWTASLNTAISSGGDVVTLGNGPAGRVWRIGGPFMQSGSPHGQLHCWHYVMALQNSSNGLLGIRYLGKITQPWTDVVTPAPARRTFTGSLKRGATTIRTFSGINTVETPGSQIGMPHYASIFTCGVDGHYDYIQGGGTSATDCVVRVVHNKNHLVRSRLLPSYELSVPVSSNATLSYVPMGAAGISRNMPGTGEREDIGVIPSWAVRYIINQSAVDERALRVTGLASAGWRTNARRSTTRQPIPAIAGGPYTGMGASDPACRLYPGSYATNVNHPSNNESLWINEGEPSHRPNCSYVPYIVTGEPQYLDLIVEHAAQIIMSWHPATSTMNTGTNITLANIYTGGWGERNVTINGVTYHGGGIVFTNNLQRLAAWCTRDIGQAAGVYPDTCPYGTQARKYFRDVADGYANAGVAFNNTRPQSWRDSGIFAFTTSNSEEAPWCHAFMCLSFCHQANIYPTTNMIALRSHLGRFWSKLNSLSDISCGISYRARTIDQNNIRAESMEDYRFETLTTVTFSSSTNRVTITGSGQHSSWSPTNGDLFSFPSAPPITGVSANQKLYAVNCSGRTMQLALTPGGAPLTITGNSSTGLIHFRIASMAPGLTAEGYLEANSYISMITGTIKFHEACGDTYIAAARATANSRLAAGGISFTADPKNLIAASYPT